MPILAWLLPLLVVLASPPARAEAQVATCVEVVTRRDDRAELRKLVESEVGRHPTHRVVETGCSTELVVEIVEIREGRFVTGRIGTQVPVRVQVERNDLAGALEELLRAVLHNDPLVLEGPRREGFMASSLGKLRREGRNLFGGEAFESLFLLEGRVLGLPGLAFRFRRETSAWHVGARLAFAGGPGSHDARAVPTLAGSLQAEVGISSSASSETAAYASALLGVDHYEYQGRAPLLGPNEKGTAFVTVPSLALRGGVEMMRTTTARFDTFLQLTLPLWPSRDIDGGVVDSWVPSLTAGAGVSF